MSLEVSPTLAHDSQGTAADASRLFKLVDRPNLMIKIPATPEGLPAIEHAISQWHQRQCDPDLLADAI